MSYVHYGASQRSKYHISKYGNYRNKEVPSYVAIVWKVEDLLTRTMLPNSLNMMTIQYNVYFNAT